MDIFQYDVYYLTQKILLGLRSNRENELIIPPTISLLLLSNLESPDLTLNHKNSMEDAAVVFDATMRYLRLVSY